MLRKTGAALAAAWFACTPPAQAAVLPPSILFASLFRAVQTAALFPDQKTFCDLTPEQGPLAIDVAYAAQRATPGFDLARFVAGAFGPAAAGVNVPDAARGEAIDAYIDRLWDVLTLSSANTPATSSLQPLPQPYVVPGQRFSELYYWDSYFIMVGLAASGRTALVREMVQDFAAEIDRFGHIPNGNRSYYLSRSQPPFFAAMLDILAKTDGESVYVQYLPELRREYFYWMAGALFARPGQASLHVVRLADGTVLNRYWDDRAAPRDESYEEDLQTAASAPTRSPADVYRDLRAAAESGWDFSSRWLADGHTLGSVRTTAIAPVDLNSLLAHLEQTLSRAAADAGDPVQASLFRAAAAARIAAIRTRLWDPAIGAFTDLLWQTGVPTHVLSSATFMPLFFGLATDAQATTVAATADTRLLQPGGIATTLTNTGQQWDFPNGWAPLQYLAVEGLAQYRQDDVATAIATAWTRNVAAGWAATGHFVEKYDVTRTDGGAGAGGEYATQIGFGWTNAVQRALEPVAAP